MSLRLDSPYRPIWRNSGETFLAPELTRLLFHDSQELFE